MVAVVKPGKSLRNILQYNEHKTQITIDPQKQTRAAVLIHSSGYAKDTGQLSFTDKLGTLQKLTELNERTKVNSIHVSLNFHPSEKGMSVEQMKAIADAYMQKLGFGNQPYLVYQHNDSSHPHMHIVTTNIQSNGKRIKTHNIGRDRSEVARKAVERQFNLVRADDHQRQRQFQISPLNARKLLYGKSPEIGTKRAITNVLDQVLKQYKYTSLPELNAVLKNYNVVAHQGGKGSRTHQHNGLYYQVLDDKGKPAGVPIPASDFYNKPTMKYLQDEFTRGGQEREQFKRRVRNAIDLSLQKQPLINLKGLQERLHKDNIQMILRQNDQGVIYGVTYVDHQKKTVFNGSDLGKQYSANQIQQRCQADPGLNQQPQQQTQHTRPKPSEHKPATKQSTQQIHNQHTANHSFASDFISNSDAPPSTQQGAMAAELKADPRKRRRKKLKY